MIMKNKTKEQVQYAASKFKAAVDSEWITQKEIDDTLKDFEDDVLFIAVIGQMNSGKSTFINSLIFEEELLPTSATPETTVLTEIKYGEKDKIVAHFITKDDFSKIESYKREQSEDAESYASLYEKIVSIDGYEKLFGKIQEIDPATYKEYIGKNGKWVGIVDKLEIFIHNEKLKGIVIMDTPGFNDPYAVRNQNTFAALCKANVIIYMSQSDCFLDQTDIIKMTEQISEKGIGKMLVCLNHMDEHDASEWDEEVKEMEKRRDKKADELEASAKALKEENDIEGKALALHNVAELIRNAEIIPFSGVMAMIGFYLRNSSIKISEETIAFYSILNDVFDFQDPLDYLKQSNLYGVEKGINKILDKERKSILEEAPMNKLEGLLKGKMTKIIKEIRKLRDENKELEDKNKDWVEEEEKFNEFRETLTNKIKDTKLRLQNRTTSAIKETEKSWKETREEWANSKITSPDFRETYFLSSGIEKSNYNSYLNLVDNFVSNVIRIGQNKLRSDCKEIKSDEMSKLHKNLSDNLTTNNIISPLLNGLIEDLYNCLEGKEPAVKIKILCNIDHLPYTGDQTQQVFYKNRFKYIDFSDEILCNEDLDDGSSSYLYYFFQYLDEIIKTISSTGTDIINKYNEFINKAKDGRNIPKTIQQNDILIESKEKTLNKIGEFLQSIKPQNEQ